MKINPNHAMSIVLGIAGIILALRVNSVDNSIKNFKTDYDLQVDSLSAVIEKYRIHKPDMVFMDMYYNMQQSNRMIDHYLHIQELDIRDLKECNGLLYQARYNKVFEPWDDNLHTDEFHEIMSDPTLITNQFR